MWTHIESGRIYVGSAFNLADRLSTYFSKSHLELVDNYISRALLLHGYSAFSLSILQYIEIQGLSFEEARQLIKEREQSYLDVIFSIEEPNTYNILKKADSSLGFKHTEETLAKMRERKHSEETKAK